MAPRKPAGDPEKLTFEQALAELEAIIDRIQSGAVGLEESLQEYERAAGLLKRCRGILDTTEQKVEQLQVSFGKADMAPEKHDSAASRPAPRSAAAQNPSPSDHEDDDEQAPF